MLVIGNYGLTLGQSKIQMSIWSILPAPLMLGNDPRDLESQFKKILLNKEIIAINQDPLGIPGKRIYNNSVYEVWTRRLSNNKMAVVIVRRHHVEPFFPTNITINFETLNWPNSHAFVRNVFTHQNLGKMETSITLEIEPQNALMLELSSEFNEKSKKHNEVVIKIQSSTKFIVFVFGLFIILTAWYFVRQMMNRRHYMSV